MLLILLACTSSPDEPEDSPVDTEPLVEDCEIEGDEDGNGLADCLDPACEACEEENLPPSPPEIAIEPAEPTDNQGLKCVVVVPGVDPEEDFLIHQFAWLVGEDDALNNTDSVSPLDTEPGQVWTCQVRAWDGVNQSDPVQASVTILE